MNKNVKNVLKVSCGFVGGFVIGWKIASKIITTCYESSLDDIEYVKTPNDHIIIKVDEPELEKNESDSDIDVAIGGVERKPFDASDEDIII